MKVFISQPMRDKTDEQIKEERNRMIERVKELYPSEEIEIIDSFFENAPHEAKPLWFLAESLSLMSGADVVVFAQGWDQYRGCRIENACARDYGYAVIEM